MIQTLKNNVALIVAAIVLAVVAITIPAATANAQSTPSVTSDNINGNLKCGSNIDLSAGSCNKDVSGGTSTVQSTIKKIINIFSVIVGTVAVIMIIVGGFRYVTSGGASDSVSGAKNTILYAIVGLIIVALAQVIVQFVLGNTTP